jgi:hypothetical protein
MADDNQQPENNEPLQNEQWKEKKWSEEQAFAKETLARQRAEAEQAKVAAAQKAETEREAAEEEGGPEEQEAEWSARLALAKGASRTGGNEPESDQAAQTIKQLDALDKKIIELNKKMGTDYVMPYLLLTTTAAVVDVLQAVADVSLILALLASAGGVTFSVVRHYGLKYANPHASNDEHKQMLQRTLISGAISVIPYVDILPEQTAFMLREWTIKKEAIAAASGELAKLKTQRKKLAATLPK